MGLQLRDLIEVPGGDHVSLHVRCVRDADAQRPTIEDVIPHLGLQGLEREVCEMIFPVSTSLPQMELPAIEHLAANWIAWDEDLVPLRRFHFAFLDKHAFMLAAQHAGAQHGAVLRLRGSEDVLCHVELHLIAESEKIELLGRLHQVLHKQQGEIKSLQEGSARLFEVTQRLAEELHETRKALGNTLESLGAHFPQLIDDLHLRAALRERPS